MEYIDSYPQDTYYKGCRKRIGSEFPAGKHHKNMKQGNLNEKIRNESNERNLSVNLHRNQEANPATESAANSASECRE